MSKYMVFEGKNIEKALELAGRELAQEVDHLHYDVVSYGSSGIFGLVGAKKAKIRVRVNSDSRAPYQREARIEARNLVKDAFNLESADDKQKERSKQSTKPNSEFSDAIEVGLIALEKIVNEISEGYSISVENRSDRILFNVDGGNSAVLIGKRGQTLEAIQYLVEKIVNKQTHLRIRVLVDVKGYLGTRKVNLKKMAARMAEKAQKNNKPVTVGHMNAYDRRIVHMTLKDNPNVRTQSMGEGYYRKLVIFPKKRKGRKN